MLSSSCATWGRARRRRTSGRRWRPRTPPRTRETLLEQRRQRNRHAMGTSVAIGRAGRRHRVLRLCVQPASKRAVPLVGVFLGCAAGRRDRGPGKQRGGERGAGLRFAGAGRPGDDALSGERGPADRVLRPESHRGERGRGAGGAGACSGHPLGGDPRRGWGLHDARGGRPHRSDAAREKPPADPSRDRPAAHATRPRPVRAGRPPGPGGHRRIRHRSSSS